MKDTATNNILQIRHSGGVAEFNSFDLDGSARRDFVFVKDLANITLKACDGIGHGAYHFSSGTDVAILDLYNEVLEAMDLEDQPEVEVRDLGPDDVFSILLDQKSGQGSRDGGLENLGEDAGQLTGTPMVVGEAV